MTGNLTVPRNDDFFKHINVRRRALLFKFPPLSNNALPERVRSCSVSCVSFVYFVLRKLVRWKIPLRICRHPEKVPSRKARVFIFCLLPGAEEGETLLETISLRRRCVYIYIYSDAYATNSVYYPNTINLLRRIFFYAYLDVLVTVFFFSYESIRVVVRPTIPVNMFSGFW